MLRILMEKNINENTFILFKSLLVDCISLIEKLEKRAFNTGILYSRLIHQAFFVTFSLSSFGCLSRVYKISGNIVTAFRQVCVIIQNYIFENDPCIDSEGKKLKLQKLSMKSKIDAPLSSSLSMFVSQFEKSKSNNQTKDLIKFENSNNNNKNNNNNNMHFQLLKKTIWNKLLKINSYFKHTKTLN